MPVINAIAAAADDMTAWRHHLHAHPETAFNEHQTAAFVAEKLRAFGVDEVHTGIARTGVIGVIRGRDDGKGRAIGLRADMDALPMTEENDVPHRSQIPGAMHGCGHDGHTTMLLGAAQHLAATRSFAGTAILIFQPAEESEGGGEVMVKEGLFQRFPVESVWGMHNMPNLPFGIVGARAGPVMAAADIFDLLIEGKGGHAAYPHGTIDPVLVAGHIVTALQSLVSRNVSPIDSGVVSVTRIEAGSAYNVIPRRVRLAGTARSFRAETRDLLEAGIGRIATQIAAAFGATATLDFQRGYPVTVNSTRESAQALEIAAEIVGTERVRDDIDPSMGGEDFAFMLNEKPGCYIWVGSAGGPSKGMLHEPDYDFNDAILPIGASYWVRLVERLLPLG